MVVNPADEDGWYGVEECILGNNVLAAAGGRLCIDELNRVPPDEIGANGDDKVKSANGLLPPVNDVFNALE